MRIVHGKTGEFTFLNGSNLTPRPFIIARIPFLKPQKCLLGLSQLGWPVTSTIQRENAVKILNHIGYIAIEAYHQSSATAPPNSGMVMLGH